MERNVNEDSHDYVLIVHFHFLHLLVRGQDESDRGFRPSLNQSLSKAVGRSSMCGGEDDLVLGVRISQELRISRVKLP